MSAGDLWQYKPMFHGQREWTEPNREIEKFKPKIDDFGWSPLTEEETKQMQDNIHFHFKMEEEHRLPIFYYHYGSLMSKITSFEDIDQSIEDCRKLIGLEKDNEQVSDKYILLEIDSIEFNKRFKKANLSKKYLKVQTTNPLISDITKRHVVFWVNQDHIEPLKPERTHLEEIKKECLDMRKQTLLNLKKKWELRNKNGQ